MLMADTLAIALTILGALLSFVGLWLMAAALWPNRVARAGVRARDNRVKSTLLGIVVTGVMVLLTTIVSGLGAPGQTAAFAIVSLWILFASVGVAGLVTQMGRHLSAHPDTEAPWKTTARGGTAMALAYLFPILGWFILLPLSLVLGSGAVTLSFIGRRRRAVDETPASPVNDRIDFVPPPIPARDVREARDARDREPAEVTA